MLTYYCLVKRIYDQGHEVVGLDGVEKPILEFFQEQNLAYNKGQDGNLKFFSASFHLPPHDFSLSYS